MSKATATKKWQSFHPVRSTFFVALALSMIWTGVWLFIFLSTTMVLNLETPVPIFVITLWFSVVAEATIRYFENANYIAKWSKPHEEDAKGDNQDFTGELAMRYTVFFGMVPFFAFLLFWLLSGLSIEELKCIEGVLISDEADSGAEVQMTCVGGAFMGPGSNPDPSTSKAMVFSWWNSLTSVTGGLGLIVCILMRTAIYKRSARAPSDLRSPH